MAAMCELARLSDLAASVLRQHADAPAVCSVECLPGSVVRRARVSLQVWSSDDVGKLRAVAGWAVEWDSAVLFNAAGSASGSVQVLTRLEAVTAGGPVDVEVWAFVDPSSVASLGLDLPTGIEVPVSADVVLSQLDSTASGAPGSCDG